MKVSENDEAHGLFIINSQEYSGILYLKENEPIQVKLILSYKIDWIENKPIELPIVNCILKGEASPVTIINSIIFQSHFSSLGLYEYTIKSYAMIIGDQFNSVDEISFSNLHMINPTFNRWIGNSKIQAQLDTKNRNARLTIPFDGVIGQYYDEKISINIKYFYNVEKQNLLNEFIVKQNNSIAFVFATPLTLYKGLNFINTIDNFLSFLFQESTSINEVVYYSDQLINGRTINTFKHIYYKKEFSKNNDINEFDILIEKRDIFKKMGTIIPNAAESCNQMSGAASIDCDGSFQLRWTDIFVKKQRPGS